MTDIQTFLDQILSKEKDKNSLRAPERNPIVGAQADLAKKVKALLNKYETKKLGNIDSPWNKYGAGHEIGSLLFGESPELLDDVSYEGLKALVSGRTGRLPIPDKRLLDIPIPVPSAGGLGVIKNKGGNWLTGSVEKTLKRLKRKSGHSGRYSEDVLNELKMEWPEEILNAVTEKDGSNYVRKVMDEIQPSASLNQWIDNTLTKYVKNRMATPDDEVRKLADQGILHVTPENLGSAINPTVVSKYREKFGFNPHGTETNTNRLSDLWEDSADGSLIPSRAGFLASEHVVGGTKHGTYPNLETDPWLAKIDPNEPVYRIPRDSQPEYNLGFNHLIDELLNSTRPDSGLPMNLRMKPEGFKGLSMEEAVKKVHGINTFRAEQAKKVNERFAKAEGVPVYKDYGDGTRLLEYKLPDEPPKGYRKSRDGEGYFNEKDEYFPESHIAEEKRKQLESWLKQEGDTMGHCVGGYCDDVTSGRSRILSLRDKEGKSRATIEINPKSNYIRYANQVDGTKEEAIRIANELAKKHNWPAEDFERELKDIDYSYTPEIVQIKGPGNRPPDKDVLPYVQDFVKSGDWSDVGDLENIKLYRRSSLPPEEQALATSEYLTMEEIQDLRKGKP